MAAETLAYQNSVVSNGDIGANSTATKKSRENDRRRRRRKLKKNNKASKEPDTNAAEDDDDVKEIEYVPEKADLGEGFDEEFRKIFDKFTSFSEVIGQEDNEAVENDNDQKEKGVSNKKRKLQRRMKIAELKQVSSRPDIVEVWDATAAEPKLLVFLKSYRNSVPVPRHWCQKRKFLQGKRGIKKQPFQLPDFIAATEIWELWKMHDAFFKYQTKPKLSSLGDLYHEGKEFEVKLRELKPGVLLHELKEALGMPEGAPIPRSKPPVDEYGRPLYGDVFGVHQQDQPNYEEEPVDKIKNWGDLEEEEEEEMEEEEEEELEAGIQSVDSLSSMPIGFQ